MALVRAFKSIGVVDGHPNFTPAPYVQQKHENVKVFIHSSDGSRYAICDPNQVTVHESDTGNELLRLPTPGIIELGFSPKGTWICTWERYVKPVEEGTQHRNMKVWEVATGQEIISFCQKSQEGWMLQFTEDESHALRLVSGELHTYSCSSFQSGIVFKLRLEGMADFKLSPGKNPLISAFVPEKKGAPASVKIYPLSGLTDSVPLTQKTFFKSDKVQMKWNKSGTSLLLLTQTDVDKTGKSYYGETNLYLLSSNGKFDCRVTLDREGGIHDFVWSPNDKEFSVSYGYMPAKTTIFDVRCNVIHDFGTAPRNFISYNPQGRLLLVAGFGNLAGTMDVWDRRTLEKVSTIEGSNTSHCEWSPDGRFIMCATLSPRLRVDNGVRIFHYRGQLVHANSVENLYSASWRPCSSEHFPFRQSLSPAPQGMGNIGVGAAPTPVKAAGAYRPPHARGTSTPNHFKREDEGGAPYVAPTNGQTNGALRGRAGGPPGAAPRRAGVPGAAPHKANGTTTKSKKKSNENKNQDGSAQHSASGNSTLSSRSETVLPLEDRKTAEGGYSDTGSKLGPDGATSQVPLGQLSLEDKKKRALVKKLTAIEQLKERRKKGEKLEMTQIKKIESEIETRKELEALG
ncbi:eukaryotic translation initiation factor eIF2A-domain-containing protein [Phakopsora pachyrhizi]|nr:eukaryotic translation initiation factor eIF2A-domain-containing protein [Phakopsora pachyrhizi]